MLVVRRLVEEQEVWPPCPGLLCRVEGGEVEVEGGSQDIRDSCNLLEASGCSRRTTGETASRTCLQILVIKAHCAEL